MSLARQLRAIGPLPFMATVVVPVVILWTTESAELWWGSPAGVVLIGFGLFLMYRTITLFARRGEGTLAPWDPPRKLVIEGPYRHVRNPMISGVLFVLLGEAALFGSLPLLAWFGAFLLVNAIFMPLYEEPRLRERFGEDYDEYKANVPRWLPRAKGYPRGST